MERCLSFAGAERGHGGDRCREEEKGFAKDPGSHRESIAGGCVGKLKIERSICPVSILHRPEVCFRCDEHESKGRATAKLHSSIRNGRFHVPRFQAGDVNVALLETNIASPLETAIELRMGITRRYLDDNQYPV